MYDDWLDQVTAIIRSSDSVALPLEHLVAELRERFRSPLGEAELRERIEARADRLLLIETGAVPVGDTGLSGPEQARLLGALRAAGLAAAPHVMLRGEAEPATPVEAAPEVTRAVSRSLTQLWAAQPTGAPGRADLVLATRAANTLRGTLRRLVAGAPRPTHGSAPTRTTGIAARVSGAPRARGAGLT